MTLAMFFVDLAKHAAIGAALGLRCCSRCFG